MTTPQQLSLFPALSGGDLVLLVDGREARVDRVDSDGKIWVCALAGDWRLFPVSPWQVKGKQLPLEGKQ